MTLTDSDECSDDRRGDDEQADGDGLENPAGSSFVLSWFDSCCQSRQRGVASPYAVFDMPTICAGS